MKALYPVILAVPDADRLLRGREKVIRLSFLARRAVQLSAVQSGIRLGELTKSPEGAPLPAGGYYWSLSHKTDYVAGVVADFPVGLDIERFRSCTPGLYHMVADDTEWHLADAVNDMLFFRYWTAKEAVLKSAGVGLSALSKCRVVGIGDNHLELTYQHRKFRIEHFCFNGHIAAVLDHPDIRWVVLDAVPDLNPVLESETA